MKVYEKAIIHSKSNTDREDKNYKKRKNKLESPEKVDENFTYSKIEQIPNNKFSKKIKGKTKQLSATREYNRASPKYSIEDPNDGIKEIKHSSSTSKYILHKFKKEKEKENNSKNIDEDLLFIKPSKKEDNKINYKNKSENKRENTNKKIKKIINKSKIKLKYVLYEKLKKIILIINNKKIKYYFDKWQKFVEDKKNNEKEKEEYEEMEDQEGEEEIEEEEEEEHSELEEIEERPPNEEESTITKQKSTKKKYTSAKMKLILRNILRFKNPLKIYLRKCFLIINGKLVKKEKNIKNNNLFNNKSELIIKNNLKIIIELGKTRKRILKKYFKKWRFITFNLEPVIQNSSRIYKNQEDNKNAIYEQKYKQKDSNDKRKYNLISKSSDYLLNDNVENNQNLKIKLSKRLKFLKHIIETLDDYKQISYYMSKWYYLTKNYRKSKKIAKNKILKNSTDILDELSGDNKNQNQQVSTQSTYFNMNSLSSKEEISSDNCQKILANSININNLIIKGNKKNKKEEEKEQEKEEEKEQKKE